MTTKPKTVPELRFPGGAEPWENKKIGTIAKTITSGSRDWAQYYAQTGSKFIRMTNLPRGGIQLLLDDLRFVELPENSSEGKRTSLEANDVLISITAELGKIGWIPPGFGTAYINQHTALLRLDLDRADARFIAHLLSSERMNNEINSLNDAGAKAGLNLPTIRSFPLHLPSLPEQRKIADFLTAVDGRIGQLSQKKALLEDYKKGVMQQLFTQALRFKDDHGNDFPAWEEKTLREVLAIGSGRDYKHLGKGNIPVYGSGGVMTFVDASLHVGESVCIGRKGTIDKPRFVEGAFWTVDTLFYTHSFKRVLPRFIYAVFQQINWKTYNEASGVPSLSKSTIESIPVSIPSLPEQTKIANFLSALDRKIESVAQQITHTQAFKKGLLQQMFV